MWLLATQPCPAFHRGFQLKSIVVMQQAYLIGCSGRQLLIMWLLATQPCPAFHRGFQLKSITLGSNPASLSFGSYGY